MASDLAGITLPSSYLPGTHPPSTDASATSLMGDNETKDSIQLATAALHNTGRNFNGSYGSGSFRPVVRDDAPSNVTYVYNQYGAFISHYHTGGTQSATTIPQQGELGIIDPELQASVPAIRYQVKADEQE